MVKVKLILCSRNKQNHGSLLKELRLLDVVDARYWKRIHQHRPFMVCSLLGDTSSSCFYVYESVFAYIAKLKETQELHIGCIATGFEALYTSFKQRRNFAFNCSALFNIIEKRLGPSRLIFHSLPTLLALFKFDIHQFIATSNVKTRRVNRDIC